MGFQGKRKRSAGSSGLQMKRKKKSNSNVELKTPEDCDAGKTPNIVTLWNEIAVSGAAQSSTNPTEDVIDAAWYFNNLTSPARKRLCSTPDSPKTPQQNQIGREDIVSASPAVSSARKILQSAPGSVTPRQQELATLLLKLSAGIPASPRPKSRQSPSSSVFTTEIVSAGGRHRVVVTPSKAPPPLAFLSPTSTHSHEPPPSPQEVETLAVPLAENDSFEVNHKCQSNEVTSEVNLSPNQQQNGFPGPSHSTPVRRNLFDKPLKLQQERPSSVGVTNAVQDKSKSSYDSCRCWCHDCDCCSLGGAAKLLKQIELVRVFLNFETMKTFPEGEFKRMTGITVPQFDVLMAFLDERIAMRLKYKYDAGTPLKDLESDLTPDNRLLITLLRLRGGWDEADLATFFKTSVSTVSAVFNTWIQFMYFQFKRIQSAMFVKKDLQKRKDRPLPFKPFNNFRVCLDTTEVEIERPGNFDMQGNTYSDYKGANVILYMIGISCWGGISYISPGFEGSKTDVQIFKESGIIEFLEEDDLLLVDRGFPIEEECDGINVLVLHPPFLGPREKFTPEEEQLTRDIAHARIYVEHAIRRMKTFQLWKRVKNTMLPILDQIVYVIGCLVNFQVPIVKMGKGKSDDNAATKK
ncbi:uncharacterized protein LOC113215893 isoform X2 [Frankliniella occidentalis]|uniref:Uncharacterized protein LOC113215893 isoform X2 n=1 Tax=Frankliniella occidentalis TaxID=133901 RepID=A0A6J1TCU8_FRAOC|nr:uncharacterized protein LOC113215893 isoform X2 [Frankliniella occidentalis]